MADFSSMLTFAPELLRNMPQMLFLLQIGFFILFVRVFGWIIMLGFRGYLPWHMKLLARIGFGFISYMCAISLAGLIHLGGTGIYKFMFAIFWVDVWIAGIISTAVLTISVYLISDKFYNTPAMEKAMEKLKMKLEKAKSVEKDMAGKTMKENILQPMRIAGIIAFVCFLAFALMMFRGFPDPSERFLSAVGLTQQDLDTMQSYMQALSPNQTAMPDGCVSPLELAQNFQQAIISNELPIYADSGIRNFIQTNTNESVAIVYRAEYKGRAYALAITDKQSICSATGSQFCGCLNLGTMGG